MRDKNGGNKKRVLKRGTKQIEKNLNSILATVYLGLHLFVCVYSLLLVD